MEGYVNIDEFFIMMNFILEKQVPEIHIKSLFNIFCNDLTKRLSFNLFSHLIQNGSQINPIYLKLKHRFGSSKYNFIVIF